ncbi:MAG TPA: hypothetical protein VFM18_17415 [Methanosarcina sp.]|nr:hypothetical protein [Methanosarcina sp.]
MVVTSLTQTKLNGHTWHAVSIRREKFDEVFKWTCATISQSRGTYLCWADISEIWFEFEEDAAFCMLTWH